MSLEYAEYLIYYLKYIHFYFLKRAHSWYVIFLTSVPKQKGHIPIRDKNIVV